MAKRTAIGLDIGTSGVRAAELAYGKNGITLEKFGQVALPSGAVRNGEVVDVDSVAEAIKNLWAHTKFGDKKVIVGVANQKVIVRSVSLPYAPLDDVKASLPYTVGDSIPMAVENALLDFYPVDEVDEAGEHVIRGLLVAAARDMVETHLKAVAAAGLTTTMVDLTSFAVLRAVADADHLGMGAPLEALVDVGSQVTNIVIHEGGVPRFVRILQQGGQDVTSAVADRLSVSDAQAEELKRSLGMKPDSEDPREQAAGRVMDTAGKAWVEDVRNSLDFFTASPDGRPVDRIVVTGGGSRLAGLAETLQDATRIPVTRGQAFAELAVGDTGLSTEQMQFVEPAASVPVGLALGGVA